SRARPGPARAPPGSPDRVLAPATARVASLARDLLASGFTSRRSPDEPLAPPRPSGASPRKDPAEPATGPAEAPTGTAAHPYAAAPASSTLSALRHALLHLLEGQIFL